MTDCFYMLEEALTVVHPQLLVIETYPLADYKQKELSGISLSCQYQSFENRRNIWLKLKSTPALFSLDNAPFAWSRTLRNHSYIFEKQKLILHNFKNPPPPVYEDEEYLGRFISFTEGLTQATLDRYAAEGPPVDGKDMIVGKEAEQALARIRALCEEKGIRVMFLTIPMYICTSSIATNWKRTWPPSSATLPGSTSRIRVRQAVYRRLLRRHLQPQSAPDRPRRRHLHDTPEPLHPAEQIAS